MNIVSAQQKSRHGRRRSGVSTLVDDVTRRIVPSPMLTPGGGSSKSGSYSNPRCYKEFEDGIENIDGYEYVPLMSYRPLQRGNATLKKRMTQMEGAHDELQNYKMGQTKISKRNWTTLEFENKDKIKKYLREDVHPHHPYPPPNWLRYSESNRTLCATTFRQPNKVGFRRHPTLL